MWRCRAVTGLTHPIPPQPRCRPLVILHERHFFNQTSLPQSDQAIIRRWTAEGTFACRHPSAASLSNRVA